MRDRFAPCGSASDVCVCVCVHICERQKSERLNSCRKVKKSTGGGEDEQRKGKYSSPRKRNTSILSGWLAVDAKGSCLPACCRYVLFGLYD